MRARVWWSILRRPPITIYYQRAARGRGFGARNRACARSIENAAAETSRPSSSFARVPNGGLIVLPDITHILHRDLIIALAARYRLPAVYTDRLFVAAGGLMCYSTDRVDQFRQAASYIDRILRGANPADLPVQAPTKFETVINLKTAKALGLTVPSGCSLQPTRSSNEDGASSSRCSAAQRRLGRLRRVRSSRRCPWSDSCIREHWIRIPPA